MSSAGNAGNRIRAGIAALGLALMGLAGGATPALGGSQTTGIYANQFSGAFKAPVSVASAPGAPRLVFVVEQRGVVRVVRNGTKLRRPFLDIRRLVTYGGEQGLLSIAFHPRYDRNGKLYAYYTNNRCGSSGGCNIEVAEFRRKAGTRTRARASSHRRVIAIGHRQAPNHNGGTVAFGLDGKLWLATGDGGGGDDTFDHARKRGSLLGKLLRIDPRRARDSKRGYRIPADNPFVDAPGRDEIWSIGLRNPFRFSFDEQLGAIAIGDVGQSAREEVNILRVEDAKGANFGWPQYEGDELNDPSRPGPGPLVDPVYAYPNPAGAAAVTGGLFLRDERFQGVPDADPGEGIYLFADAYSGPLQRFEPLPDFSGATDYQTLPNADVPAPVGFGTDQQGRIYVASLTGRVYRLDPAP